MSYSGPVSDPAPWPTDPVAPRPRRPWWILVAAVIVGLALVAAAIGLGLQAISGSSSNSSVAPPVTKPTAPMPTPPADLSRFYEQKLDWSRCGENRCTKLTVPLDYADPSGETIEIAVLSVPASQPRNRIGSLVVNPGGPGGSGVDYAASAGGQFGSALTKVFDIVGFDPRGVGRSDPLTCLNTAGQDELLAFDPDPDTPAEKQQYRELLRGLGQACVRNSGDLVQHISTVEAAKDMDVLRAALGEPRLNYLGASYGTFLGATYAELFPKNVGRLVLDGAIDPSLSNVELNREQAEGFQTAFRAYLADCIERGDCPLGDSIAAGEKRMSELFAQIEQRPLPTNDPKRPLTAGLATLGVFLPLYVKEYWGPLTRGLNEAIDDGRGSVLLAFADAYASRGPKGYSDNSIPALYAVNCLDHSDGVPLSQVESLFPSFEKASPTFGRTFAFGVTACNDWPAKGGVSKPIRAAGAPPIVVIGTTRDPATPYKWAVALADQLASGRLITRDGDGHTGYGQGSSCVDDAVESFLVDGKAPSDGLRCGPS